MHFKEKRAIRRRRKNPGHLITRLFLKERPRNYLSSYLDDFGRIPLYELRINSVIIQNMSISLFFQLERLLEEVRKVTLERHGALPTKSALFVCNKWEGIPEKERNEVKNKVNEKLQKCWPGVDPESQIIYMSTTNAILAQDYKIVTEEFSTLMKGLRCMVLKSIGDMLEIHWK